MERQTAERRGDCGFQHRSFQDGFELRIFADTGGPSAFVDAVDGQLQLLSEDNIYAGQDLCRASRLQHPATLPLRFPLRPLEWTAHLSTASGMEGIKASARMLRAVDDDLLPLVFEIKLLLHSVIGHGRVQLGALKPFGSLRAGFLGVTGAEIRMRLPCALRSAVRRCYTRLTQPAHRNLRPICTSMD